MALLVRGMGEVQSPGVPAATSTAVNATRTAMTLSPLSHCAAEILLVGSVGTVAPESPVRARTGRRTTAVVLLVFALLAFAFSWTVYLAAPPEGGPLAAGMRMLASFGPGLAAVALVAWRSGTTAVRGLVAPLARWRIGWRWYLGSLVGPPTVMAVGVAAYAMAGGTLGPSENDPGLWWAIPLIFGVVLVVGGPLGEEVGWRGFALQRAQQSMSPVSATVVVALMWALWHLPQMTDPEAVQYEVPWTLFFGQILVMSVFYTWLVNRTGSLVPAVLLHASFNTSVGLLPVLPSATSPVGPAVISLALGALAAGLLLVRTRGRLGHRRDLRAGRQKSLSDR
jgi:uncharacterized protein